MNEQTFSALGYDNLLMLLMRYANTPMGKARVERLAPHTNLFELERDLQAIAETFALNEKQISWRFSELREPSDAVAILRIKNATLEPTVMLELVRLCNQALFARSAIQPEKESAPTLWKTVETLPPTLLETINLINKKLLPAAKLTTRLRRN